MSPAETVVDLEVLRKAQRADGPASILAIGTANPSNGVDQSTYPDYYFRITNSEHNTKLKAKFTRICNKSMVRKRHMYLTEEIVKQNPMMCRFDPPSMDNRLDMLMVEVPKLAKEAAEKAIEEWGQPKSKITHLVFASSSTGMDMPSADLRLTKLLGLEASVKRVMMYPQGCFTGTAVLRVAKDLAENNRGARVLVVCAELVTILTFRAPSDTHIDNLIAEALFADGAAALIVGADPIPEVEKACFQLIWTAQTIIPDSDGAVVVHVRGVRQTHHLGQDLPGFISNNIEKSLIDAFQQFGISDWNKLFWIAHPGGPAILDQVEANLNLDPKKLRASRHVLSEYGNMASATVHFMLDEMRKASRERGCSTTGEGLDIGVLFGFGPGVTVETVVLKSIPL